jgi:hypothetical protein
LATKIRGWLGDRAPLRRTKGQDETVDPHHRASADARSGLQRRRRQEPAEAAWTERPFGMANIAYNLWTPPLQGVLVSSAALDA